MGYDVLRTIVYKDCMIRLLQVPPLKYFLDTRRYLNSHLARILGLAVDHPHSTSRRYHGLYRRGSQKCW